MKLAKKAKTLIAGITVAAIGAGSFFGTKQNNDVE